MEFDHDQWRRNPGSAWLVKRFDERVHAVRIQHVDAEGVEVVADGKVDRLAVSAVEWIRPLISAQADGWEVVAGFQPEDQTFDTWWNRGSASYCINYSGPTGFSDLAHLITASDKSTEVAPSLAARTSAREQIADALERRRNLHVHPIDHLQ